MGVIKYGFVEKDMYDHEECFVDVFKTQEEAVKKMESKVNTEIGRFVRDMGYAPFVRENKEINQITIIYCHPEDMITLNGADGDEIPRTDYRVIEVTVHD